MRKDQSHRFKDFTKPSRADLRKYGFTLAEVLITLAIVGVVAAITMPALIANIQDRVRTARIQNIKQKFSKATDKMMSLSTLNGYASTMEFVNELQKHLKIAKVCDNQHLTECWPTEKVWLDEETEWEIKDTKTYKELQLKNENGKEYDDTVGVITADGTSIILTYDKNCNYDISKEGMNWSQDAYCEKGCNSATTSCVAAVFDWNGSKMPNKLGGDVVSLNGASLGSGCFFEINGGCFKAPQAANTYMTKAECEAKKGDLGINACYYDNDYWAKAVETCGHVDKMASAVDLAAIASDIYGTTIGEYDDKEGISYNASIGSKYGFSDANSASFWVWSGRENSSSYAYDRGFNSTNSYWGGSLRRNSSGLVLCKGD